MNSKEQRPEPMKIWEAYIYGKKKGLEKNLVDYLGNEDDDYDDDGDDCYCE